MPVDTPTSSVDTPTSSVDTSTGNVEVGLLKKNIYAVLSRLIQVVLTLFVISIAVFVITQALPGDVATIIGGKNATPEDLARIREQLGLNDSFVHQYLSWIGGVLNGDFGLSLVSQTPIGPSIAERGFNTFVLAAISLVVVIIISLVLGMYSAWRKDKLFDRIVFGGSILGNAIPDFIVGAFLVLFFSTYVFHWLPAVSAIGPGEMPWASPRSLIMPCLTLIIPGAAYLSRLIRAGFIDILDSPYIRMARLKGLSSRAILFKHALPNALSAAVPAFSLVAALMVGAVVIVEFLFNYPGIGGYLLDGINDRDLPVIQATGLVIGAAVYLLNLIADLLSKRFSI